MGKLAPRGGFADNLGAFESAAWADADSLVAGEALKTWHWILLLRMRLLVLVRPLEPLLDPDVVC